MCVHPVITFNQGKVQSFPCGKCHECLGRKAEGYVQLYAREAQLRGSMHFVTLTYSPDHLPYVVAFPSKDGQLTSLIAKPSKIFLSSVRQCYDDPTHGVMQMDNGQVYAIPSLCRKDVRNWIKEFRNKNDLIFSYSFIGEYGKKGRPHYHGAIFGLTTKQVQSLCMTWKHGFSDCKDIPLLSEKGDVISVSRYIAKYMHKGTFDNVLVGADLVERPRVISSLNLGFNEESEKDLRTLSDWYLARDVYPGVDCFDFPFNDEYLTLVEERLKHYVTGGKSVKLSKRIKDKIFKYDYKDPETGSCYKKATPLALALASRVQGRLTADAERLHRTFQTKWKEAQNDEQRAMVMDGYKAALDSLRLHEESVSISYENNHKRALQRSKL